AVRTCGVASCERGGRRLVRGRHGDRLRGGAGGALIVGHFEGDGVGPPDRVRVGRVLRGRGCPVTEGPAVSTDRAVRVAARAREAARQPAAARRERGGRRLVRGRHGDGLRGGGRRALIVA